MGNEKQGRREQIDQMVRHMVQNGSDPKKAKKKAVECAVRADRRDDRK